MWLYQVMKVLNKAVKRHLMDTSFPCLYGIVILWFWTMRLKLGGILLVLHENYMGIKQQHCIYTDCAYTRKQKPVWLGVLYNRWCVEMACFHFWSWHKELCQTNIMLSCFALPKVGWLKSCLTQYMAGQTRWTGQSATWLFLMPPVTL